MNTSTPPTSKHTQRPLRFRGSRARWLFPAVPLILGALVCFFVVRLPREPQPNEAGPGAMNRSTMVRDEALVRRETIAEAAVSRKPAFENSWAEELQAMRELAVANPEAAFARIAHMPDKHERKAAVREVCLIVTANDPARAMIAAWEFDLGRFSDERAENDALERLAGTWAKVDLVGVLSWAATLPADDESRRDRVVKGIASTIARNDPALAARVVAEGISPGSRVQVDAAIAVLRAWARSDYDRALQWTALFPEGHLKDRGIEELARLSAGNEALDRIPLESE